MPIKADNVTVVEKLPPANYEVKPWPEPQPEPAVPGRITGNADALLSRLNRYHGDYRKRRAGDRWNDNWVTPDVPLYELREMRLAIAKALVQAPEAEGK